MHPTMFNKDLSRSREGGNVEDAIRVGDGRATTWLTREPSDRSGVSLRAIHLLIMHVLIGYETMSVL